MVAGSNPARGANWLFFAVPFAAVQHTFTTHCKSITFRLRAGCNGSAPFAHIGHFLGVSDGVSTPGDDRMVGYLKDGRETAPGLGTRRHRSGRIGAPFADPEGGQPSNPHPPYLSCPQIVSRAKARGLSPKDRRSPISISPLASRSIGDASASDHTPRQIRPASPEVRSL
jgi:hypothetical protein